MLITTDLLLCNIVSLLHYSDSLQLCIAVVTFAVDTHTSLGTFSLLVLRLPVMSHAAT